MTGLIIKNGFIVSEWGDINRVDMTFSISKTYLSTVIGVALDKGLIQNVNDKVQIYVPTEHFESEHNSKITWDHLLRQTSHWKGTLWDKPDWADRPPKMLLGLNYRINQCTSLEKIGNITMSELIYWHSAVSRFGANLYHRF